MLAFIALLKSFAVIAYVGLVIHGVARGCRFAQENPVVRIASGHSTPDSVARLAARCTPRGGPTAAEWVAGRVSAGNVRLWRRVGNMQNSFRPVFSGDFRQEGEQVVLVGEFGMAAGTLAFLMFWAGSTGVALLAGLYAAVAQQRAEPLAFAAGAAGLLVMCAALAAVAKKSSAGDVAWPTSVMQEALAAP